MQRGGVDAQHGKIYLYIYIHIYIYRYTYIYILFRYADISVIDQFCREVVCSQVRLANQAVSRPGDTIAAHRHGKEQHRKCHRKKELLALLSSFPRGVWVGTAGFSFCWKNFT